VVSKTITDLEHTLGVRLFDRKPGESSSPPTGARCSSAAPPVFDEMRQGLEQIAFLSDPESGELHAGTNDIRA
jgi:DNA-binding transcriptional LysR family regulator